MSAWRDPGGKKLIKIEDCTKEELVRYIKNYCFYSQDKAAFDILMSRCEIASENAHGEREKATDALGEYAKVLRPYDGKSIKDIPDVVFKKAKAAYDRYQKHIKAADKFDTLYFKTQKQIDAYLNNRTCDT